MEDYEGALDYHQQALRGEEKVLGKTHPDTLRTIMSMAKMYATGMQGFTKAGEIYRLALDGYKKPPKKNHEHTKSCAKNLEVLYEASKMIQNQR